MFPRRGAIALVTTALAVVLLFNFKTPNDASGAAIASTGGSTVGASPNSSGSTSTGAAATNPAATPTPASIVGSATAQTVTGSLISTQFGDVEVRATVAGGKITAVEAVALPSGGRSGRISAAAGPILASEALTAQSANIDIVSGATYTSRAYAQSLQAALDQVGTASAQVSG